MKFLLDTNACVALLNGSSATLSRRLRAHVPADMGLPSVVAFELYYGAYKSSKVNENLRLLQRMPFEVLELDREDAREAGEIRSRLEAVGLPIGPYDLLIAGQAKRRNLTLITANYREFARVQGLSWQDWTGNSQSAPDSLKPPTQTQ